MTSVSIQYDISQGYEPFYLSFLAVCLIIAVQVYRRVHANIGRELENRSFRRIILVYILYICVDFVWVILAFHTDSVTPVLFLEYLESGILCLFTFSWFVFAEHYIHGFSMKNRKKAPLYAIPLAVAAVNTVLHCLNAAGLLGTAVWSADCLYAINVSADIFYMLFAFVHTFWMLLREKRRTRRVRDLVIMECILYPAIGALLSFFISFVPYIILGILPSIIKVLLEMQNANIYNDALTGVNNRYRVNEFLERRWEHCSKQNPLRIYMIDVDKFKNINDTFGHLEGDKALVAVADTLKKAAGEGFVIGRFGGDEFILVDPKNSDPDQVKRELRKGLSEIAAERNFPYQLTISIGSAVCTDPGEEISAVQARADKALYADKKANGGIDDARKGA